MRFVPNAITRGVARSILHAKATSPTTLFVIGIVGFGATVVLASRATLKLDRMMEEIEKDQYDVQTKMEGESEQAHLRAQGEFYARTAVKVGRLYAPAVVVGITSAACLTGSHKILTSRNVALMSAYAGIEKAFNAYRKAVREEVGTERERQLRYGSRTVLETKIDEKGNEVVATKTRLKRDLANPVYARFFDETNPNWQRRGDYNFMFLETQQRYFNNLLISRGHVFLNEVYDALGMDRSQAGQIMGWILTPDGSTDAQVDFGIFDNRDSSIRFVNRDDPAILLDFNVTNVYKHLGRR